MGVLEGKWAGSGPSRSTRAGCFRRHAAARLTRAAVAALAPDGITVNAIAPGRMETDMAERLDAAVAAVWLASPAADYVTACRLNVSGGLEID